MKKFEVFFSSLFIIGLIGVLSLYFLTDKPTENYVAASLISVIVMLPKIFLEIFNVSQNSRLMMLKITRDLSFISRNHVAGRIIAKFFFVVFLRFLSFYIALLVVCGWIFSAVTESFILPAGLVALALYLWGRSYDRKHNPEGEVISVEEVDDEEENDAYDDYKEIHENIDFIEMISLVATEKDFVVKDNFKVSQVKYEGRPYIRYIDLDFQNIFFDCIEKAQPKRYLNSYKAWTTITQKNLDIMIKEENHYAFLQDIWQLLELYEQGDKRLAENGAFNTFPVEKDNGKIFIITVINNDDVWEIDSYEEIGELLEGENFFSHN